MNTNVIENGSIIPMKKKIVIGGTEVIAMNKNVATISQTENVSVISKDEEKPAELVTVKRFGKTYYYDENQCLKLLK